MEEREWSRKLADRILDDPDRDPDDDLSVLARQLLRADERIDAFAGMLRAIVAYGHPATAEMAKGTLVKWKSLPQP